MRLDRAENKYVGKAKVVPVVLVVFLLCLSYPLRLLLACPRGSLGLVR